MFRLRLIQTLLPVALVTSNCISISKCDESTIGKGKERFITARQIENGLNSVNLKRSQNEPKTDVKIVDSFLSTIDIAQQKFIQKRSKGEKLMDSDNPNQELEDTIKMLEIKLKRIKKVEHDEKIDLSELIRRVEIDLKKGVDLLADISTAQGEKGNETKDMYERALAKSIKHYGPEGANTGQEYANLGNFYYELAAARQTAESRRELLFISKSNYDKAERILIKIFGPDHPRTIEVSSILSIISQKL
jgi:hypothetical protein